MTNLTKKETEVMRIFWKLGEPVKASDIAAQTSMSVYSVQQVLARLLESGLIQVAGITHTKKAIARTYEPVMSEADFIYSTLNGDNTGFEFSLNYVKGTESREQLCQLEKEIQDKLKALKEQQ